MRLAQGLRLGPYEIVSVLGVGGMGEVYRARDTRLNRDIAIKVLPASFAADAEHLRRFEREAQAAGALNHPNILAVFDVGSHDDSPFLVCELLRGETLASRLKSGPLPPARALDFARQLAAGLAAAHAQGIIHRDIKPANLFLTTEGRLKILDFGLAKPHVPETDDVTRPQSLTESGVVLGTLGYMAPEQVRGQRADPRTDIFAFGVVLYEMLTGQRPFAGPSAVETMHAILRAPPPDLPTGVALAAPALVRILGRCLEKDPDERFHSAHDLGLALELLGAGSAAEIVQSEPDLSGQPAPRSAAHLAALTVAVLVAGGAGLWAGLRWSRTPADPPAMTFLTYSGHDASPAASPDGKTIAFMSDRNGTPQIWLKQMAGGGELALTQGSDDFPRFSPDGSAILFIRTAGLTHALYRVPLLGGDPRKLLDDVAGADWSLDGRLGFTRWVSGDRNGSIVGVADPDGTNAHEVTFISGRALITPRWSPDGRTIAAVNGRGEVSAGFGVDLVDVAGKTSRLLPTLRANMRVSSVVWSADSRAIIYSEAESVAAWLSGSSARIVREDTASGTARTLLWVPNHSLTLDTLGPGRLLLDARSSRENLIESGTVSGEPAKWLTHGNSTDRQPTYSPDGQWVAFSSNRGGNLDLWAVNRTTGVVRRLTDDPGDDWDVAYSPNGKRLLWGSNRTGPYEVWTASPDGSDPHQLSHDGQFAQNPQETPDGHWVVYHSTHPAHPGLWRIHADGTDPVRLVTAPIQLPEISPDGRLVLFVDGLAARVSVVRLADGKPVPFDLPIVQRKDTTAVLGRARWMPDGRAIAFIGQDERGVNGIFVQAFVPGHDTTASRHALGGFDPENSVESFAISPDGKHLTVAGWEQLFNVVSVGYVAGVDTAARSPK